MYYSELAKHIISSVPENVKTTFFTIVKSSVCKECGNLKERFIFDLGLLEENLTQEEKHEHLYILSNINILVETGGYERLSPLILDYSFTNCSLCIVVLNDFLIDSVIARPELFKLGEQI